MQALKARRMFGKFIKSNDLTQRAAAQALGVSAPTIHDWINGTKRPAARHREAIERWTGGVVPATAWATDLEQKAVRSIEPFRPDTKRSGTDG